MKVRRIHSAGPRAKTIRLDKIRLDGDTQSRVSLDDDVIKEYTDLIKDGHQFPPLDVVFDGSDYWMYDGFHRRWGAIKAGKKEFKCRVIEGTREDARWLSYGANLDHGLPRNNEDKAKAVLAALKHPKGAKLSDSRIAQHVGVGQPMVSRYRKQLESTYSINKSDERTGRDGRTTDTSNIGKRNGRTMPPIIDDPSEPKRKQALPEATPEESAETEAIVDALMLGGTMVSEARETITNCLDACLSGKPAWFHLQIADCLEELARTIREAT